MKTIEELEALLPKLIDLVLDNAEIGDCNEGGETNYVCYEEDGWCIEICFECEGEWEYDYGDYWTPPSCDLIRGWGEVTEITAGHYDEATGETTDFEEDDLGYIWNEIDKALSNL